MIHAIKTIGIILLIMIAFFGITMCIHYCEINKLCDKIEAGAEIETNVSDAYTAPKFFEKILLVLDIPQRLRSPLLTACYFGNVQAVEELLENGADPDTSLFGWNALENAVHSHCSEKNRYNIIRLLVNHGANVNAFCSSQKDGEIIWSLPGKIRFTTDEQEIYYLEQTILLLASNGSVLLSSGNWSLIHHIAPCNDCVFMEKIIYEYDLKKYINDQTTILGYSPLICSIVLFKGKESDHKEMIKLLLREGADVTLKDSKGKTAYDYAIENGYYELAEMIKPNSDGVTE